MNANEKGLRAIPPWTRSASDLRGASTSPRTASITPGPQQHGQQQQGARLGLTLDAPQSHDRGVGADDEVSFTGDGGFSGSGGVSASSAVRYDAW